MNEKQNKYFPRKLMM